METVPAEEGRCAYRWTISDTGVGMSEEFLQHIFEPFAQEKNDARSVYQGTGLGMAIVKSLVEKMNGTIRVESRLGEGSTFTVTIPFDIAPPPETQPAREEAAPDIQGLRILLAEGNELNAEIAEMLLRDEGAEVLIAHDGRQALERFRDTTEGTFDAILMDVMMPVMDGLEATRANRALERADAGSISIIVMTANAFQEDAQECLRAGMNALLSKPLDMDKLVRTLSALCRGGALRQIRSKHPKDPRLRGSFAFSAGGEP